MKLIGWIKKYPFKIGLFLITLILCIRNFTPNTYLIGWDNLMPELNIWMNIKRSIFAVWQQYQGLGLVGGMAHSTDLIRQIIILPLSTILPSNLIRYFWHFAMLFLGTFGIYIGLNKTLKFKPFPSFVAALFYLLNFGSVQNFWVPLETFSCFWGFFPWLIFSLIDYINNPNKSKLRKLIIINFLTIPSFYVQTIFIVYLFTLFIIFLFHTKSLSAIVKILLLNSFWLLPLAYFTLTNLNNSTASISNFMSSEETFTRNFLHGGIPDFLLLKGYYFDFPKNNGFLMDPWVNYFKSPTVILGYLLGISAVIGLIIIIFKKQKNILEKSLIGFFLLVCLALLSHTPPFQQLNELIRQIPVINQIFRSPWTKFITVASFTFSVLIAFFLEKIPSKIHQITCLIFSIFILVFSFPSFNGFYIYPDMRQKIPQSYFQLFNFFKDKDKNARIANLPQGSFWGWTNYRWGTKGSGFIWYGIEQPILDRAFDAWNLKNEQYYWELTHSIQKQDPTLINQIFEKYSIQYVIFDDNLYFPDDQIYDKLSMKTPEFLSQIPSLKKVAQFDKISVYQTNFKTKSYIINSPISVNNFNFYYYDPAFTKYGPYINNKSPEITYPFIDLFTNRLTDSQSFKVSKSNDLITVSNKFGLSATLLKDISFNKNYEISLPNNNSTLTVFHFPLANLNKDFLVEVNYHHNSGLPFEISAVSDIKLDKYFDIKLKKSPNDISDWLIIPAHQNYDFDSGISLILNNPKIGATSSSNQINYINIYPFNLKELANQETISNSNNFDHDYVVYPQNYSSGWFAFYFQGLKPVFLKNHVLANNWANAWELPDNYDSSSKIYYLFWPQIFEFIGFGITVFIFIKSFKRNNVTINHERH